MKIKLKKSNLKSLRMLITQRVNVLEAQIKNYDNNEKMNADNKAEAIKDCEKIIKYWKKL